MTRLNWPLLLLGFGLWFWAGFGVDAQGTDQNGSGNRLVYLDEADPFYPDAHFPKLITPQWVGETNVDAVVILAIDDMNSPDRWEKFLRPILERLKKIDGRAPVSIMTVSVDPQNAQLQQWLAEGLSFEVHTLKHPCPLLAQGNLQAAQETYHQCVALLNQVAGNRPVAFRMPCCDSMDSASPRFYAEIFNRTNSLGQFLTIDSSVMHLFTTNDPGLPRELTRDANGREKFRRYVPFPAFTTTIENYPYPYVIGKLCWEFPGMAPSDWEAQNVQGTNNPVTVADWEAALDATVIKQGTMNMIFHPHGWIRNDQIVELIDYAVERYGNRVRFLTFREAQERIDKYLLGNEPLRAQDGQDNGVRLLDLNNDGYLDVVVGNERVRQSRVWQPDTRSWSTSSFPAAIVSPGPGGRSETGLRFGIIQADGNVTALVRNGQEAKGWTFKRNEWVEEKYLTGLDLDGKAIFTATEQGASGMRDNGVRLRDLDGDGRDELIVGNESQNGVFRWSEERRAWSPLPYSLPRNARIVDARGRDNGLRFVDVNGDGFADVILSNEKYFSLHLFIVKPYLGFDVGWSREVFSGQRGDFGEIPMITQNGSNYGAWFKAGHFWAQNENTAALPDKVDRRSFDSLLAGIQAPALSPEESLKAIHVRPGFKVELVAQEPLVQDPIAFEWGADGKLWVVEMGDYPLGTDGKGKPGGVVLFLEDTNHDGIYDKSTKFLEGLNFPTGVMPWGKGVIVSAAPEIFYAEDTDGDGKADARRILYNGFGEGNQQHRLNGFDYGLDNWLYGANGDSGGSIHSRLKEDSSSTGEAVGINGRDFRFRPGDGSFESEAGETQFGRHRDDWGNWFGNNNSVWLWHYLFPEHYIARNPHLPVKNNKRMLANYEGAPRVYPICRPQQRFNDIGAASQVTSANSATPYRDEVFGPDFATSVFISEPVYNLIHREVLENDGVSFKSHRSEDEKDNEFLASTDNWFRPTMIKTGPDGALYVADMYRFVIEHPEWIPGDVKDRLDLRAGHDKGRIYRIYPASARLRPIPNFDALDTAGLVAALESPNGWQRDTAQRLLIERGDARAKKALARLITTSARPKTRLQALCTLAGLDGITPEILISALKDEHEGVREHAVRLSEPMLRTLPSYSGGSSPGSKQSDVCKLLLKMTDDPAIRVRYQLAFTMGEWRDFRAAQALVKLAMKKENAEMQVAVMSSAPAHLSEMVKTALKMGVGTKPGWDNLLNQLFGLAVRTGDPATIQIALQSIAGRRGGNYETWQFEALAAMLDALEREGKSLKQLHAAAEPGMKSATESLDGIFAAARAMSSPTNSEPASLMPLRLLGHGLSEMDADVSRLEKLMQPGFAIEIQVAALEGLRHLRGPLVGEVLVRSWSGSSPAIRPKLFETLTGRTDWLERLLKALEDGNIPITHMGTVERQKLSKHGQGSVRERAGKLFTDTQSDRQKVVKSYETVLQLAGDQTRGAMLFQQNCAVCHQFASHPQVGPDLGTVAGKPIETLLESILDPNRAVEARYLNYTALTRDEREVSGIIVAEGPTSITLRSATGEETVLRRDLQRLTSSGLSLMPEGFEKVLSPQDLADVIAFIRKSDYIHQQNK